MKEDVFFKVGYTNYLEKPKTKKKSWTSILGKIVVEHKVVSTLVAIIGLCVGMNFWLVYRFVCILDVYSKTIV